jgi:DNA topoisomerase IB
MTEPHPLEKAANDFLATHQNWMAQTQEELAALRTRNFKLSTDTLKKKNGLSETYQRQLKFLHDQREKLATLPSQIANDLRKSQEEFKAVSAEMSVELDMSMKLGQQFMNLIKKAVTRQLKTSHFYGKSGGLLDNVAPRSVTVNKSA